ncbi:MAG: endolytic transglycosylase MltG [Bacteroidales bacterium]
MDFLVIFVGIMKQMKEIAFVIKGKRYTVKSYLLVLVCIVAFALVALTYFYQVVYEVNFKGKAEVHLYIDTESTYEEVRGDISSSGACLRLDQFDFLAKRLKYPAHLPSGHYVLKEGMNNREALNLLRRGYQTPINIIFNNIRTLDDLAQSLSNALMFKKNDFLIQLRDSSYCKQLGFDTATVKAMFIPNTYEVYWNITPTSLLKRMKDEYDVFWTKERREQAKILKLTPIQVSVLASIVEEETAQTDEYPVIAGLYLNRLKRGMLLQSDPTVKYALGNPTLHRILFKHLTIDSPYNTYKYAGLPPGPLRIPSVRALKAVLNPSKHNYLYMCANADFSGRHVFAAYLYQHNRNARRYQAELNRRKIR